MKYVILQSGGKQYKVEEGSIVDLEKLDALPGTDITFDEILLYTQDSNILLGRPYLEGLVVVGKVLEQKKGQKIRVAKFKAKSRYRRVNGHRQHLTSVQITSIVAKETKKSETKVKNNNDSKITKNDVAVA